MTDQGQVPSVLWVSVSLLCHAREMEQIIQNVPFSDPEVLGRVERGFASPQNSLITRGLTTRCLEQPLGTFTSRNSPASREGVDSESVDPRWDRQINLRL